MVLGFSQVHVSILWGGTSGCRVVCVQQNLTKCTNIGIMSVL